jgi:hypothetical protein
MWKGGEGERGAWAGRGGRRIGLKPREREMEGGACLGLDDYSADIPILLLHGEEQVFNFFILIFFLLAASEEGHHGWRDGRANSWSLQDQRIPNSQFPIPNP